LRDINQTQWLPGRGTAGPVSLRCRVRCGRRFWCRRRAVQAIAAMVTGSMLIAQALQPRTLSTLAAPGA